MLAILNGHPCNVRWFSGDTDIPALAAMGIGQTDIYDVLDRPGGRIHVAEMEFSRGPLRKPDHVVAGVLMYEQMKKPSRILVRRLRVLDELTRMGVGSLMWRKLASKSAELGASVIALVDEHDDAAVKWLHHRGPVCTRLVRGAFDEADGVRFVFRGGNILTECG